jgi:hypothetical protein
MPVGALAWRRATAPQRPPAIFSTDPGQVMLGQALAGRVNEATRRTVQAAAAAGLFELAPRRFAKPMYDVHNLATRAIARFLITGQGTTETERNFMSRIGVMAAIHGLSVATLTRSYLLWRDTNLRILNEEVERLGIAAAVADRARAIIRSVADGGILRVARAHDDHLHAVELRVDSVIVALRESDPEPSEAALRLTAPEPRPHPQRSRRPVSSSR